MANTHCNIETCSAWIGSINFINLHKTRQIWGYIISLNGPSLKFKSTVCDSGHCRRNVETSCECERMLNLMSLSIVHVNTGTFNKLIGWPLNSITAEHFATFLQVFYAKWISVLDETNHLFNQNDPGVWIGFYYLDTNKENEIISIYLMSVS